MNEFEKDPSDRRNDFADAGNGFIFSFLFFTIIFAIGVTVSLIAQ